MLDFKYLGYRLLQSSISFQMSTSFDSPHSHRPDSIRAATLQLSKMPFSASVPVGGIGHLSLRTYGASPAPTRSETTTTPLPLPLQKTASELNTQHDEDGGFIFPRAAHTGHEPVTDSTSFLSSQSLNSSFLREIPSSSTGSDGGFGLESSIETLPPLQKLSGLSLLRPGSSSISSSEPSVIAPPSPSSTSSSSSSRVSSVLPLGLSLPSPLPILTTNEIADTTPTVTPMGTPRPINTTPLPSLLRPEIKSGQSRVHWRSPRSIARLLGPTSPSSPTAAPIHEQTPLLEHDGLYPTAGDHDGLYSTAGDLEIGLPGTVPTLLQRLSALRSGVHMKPQYLMQAISAVPAVLLGCLLNILDGVSCGLFPSSDFPRGFGPSFPPFPIRIFFLLFHLDFLPFDWTDGMIIFPATGVFANLGPMGVSMFFISTILAQLVYSLGGSGFHGANGSMMIEVVVSFFFMFFVDL